MRHRTKTHLLTQEQIDELLHRAQTARIGTINKNGSPYVLPMHFVYFDGKIYLHGLPRGQKIDNIRANPKVCFEVDEMLSLLCENVENPCDVNTEFNSVIVQGSAKIINDLDEKRLALQKIVEKFTQHLKDMEIPVGMIGGTAVIRIDMEECVGRYYK